MKPQRKNNHGTQVAILMLASMSWGTAWGGILDFFKSPASLIMNQKHCSYMSKMPGETLNGRFIFSPGQGVVVVIMSMEQLDDNRVVAKTEQNEDRQLLVMDVKKSDGAVTAIFNSIPFLQCTL